MTAPAAFDLGTFGETMIRLAPPDHERLETATSLDCSIGGTESNLAAALVRLGRSANWISALPENPLGRRIAGEIRRHGVDTRNVVWRDDSRAGVYFLELGTGPRPTRVIYDRASSALATLPVQAVDPALATASKIFHLTGITPALSSNCAEICLRLADSARDAGRNVTFDVNYRSLLWTPEQASEGLQPFLDRASVLFCGLADARTIWGLDGEPNEVAAELIDRSTASVVVLTLGAEGALARRRDGRSVEQTAQEVEAVDPVGAGDAFAAGFLHRWLDDPGDLPGALRSGVALAGIAMTIPGDLAVITPAELETAERDLSVLRKDIER
ncbi:MAG: PfkB family carbohydrate kinase [Chloroflexota bacterium]